MRPAALTTLMAIVLLAAACSAEAPDGRVGTPSPSASQVAATPSRSPSERTTKGGVAANLPPPTIPPHERPYPYITPTPPPVASPLDGTYMRIVTLEQAGGVRDGLPPYCLRCLPYRLTPGVSTLVFYRGEFYLNHQLSGFKSQGHFSVHDHQITLLNEPECHDPATYAWEREGRTLELEVVNDPCAYGDVRAWDLTFGKWVRVNSCVFRIGNLWPATIAC